MRPPGRHWVPAWLLPSVVLALLAPDRSAELQATAPPVELPAFCGAPLTGAEGKPPAEEAEGLELAQVQLVNRHGLRSPLDPIPGLVDPFKFPCAVPQELTDAVGRWPDLFRQVTGNGVAYNPQPSLLPRVEEDGHSCQPSQLTSRGITELVSLGEHFRAAYGASAGGPLANLSSGDVYVRTTRYVRTWTSAAALLTGLLDDDLAAATLRGPFRLARREAGWPEPMLFEGCPAAMRTQAALLPAADSPPAYGEARRRLLGPGHVPPELAGLAATDYVLNTVCHDGPLPCGVGGCADEALVEDLVRTNNERYCFLYEGDLGGKLAAQLAMRPLLREIVRAMKLVAEGSPSAHRLVLFSGHDTTVAPLAAALGVFDCKWPPLASHLVFELWLPSRPDVGQPSVRVLYNGHPVTDRLDGCSGELCPLQQLDNLVEALPHHCGLFASLAVVTAWRGML